MSNQLKNAKNKIISGDYKKAYTSLKKILETGEFSHNTEVPDLLSTCQRKGVRTKLNDIWISKTDFKINSKRISSVGFSSDSKFVIMGFRGDFSIRIYDIETGNEISKLKGHTGGVSSVCGSTDCRCIGSRSYFFKNLWFGYKHDIKKYDNTIRLWDFLNGKEISNINCDSGLDFGCFSLDGNFFSSVDHFYSKIGLFDFISGTLDSACFSPNARLLACQKGFSEPIRLLDIYDGVYLKSLGNSVDYTPIYFSPDGRYLIYLNWARQGGTEQNIELWDVDHGKIIMSFSGHKSYITSLNFSPDGRFIVSGGIDKTIRIYDVRKRKTIKILKGHKDWVVAVSFSPDSRYLISLSFDRLILWELDWEMEFPNEVKWHENVEPFARNFIEINNYQWTDEQYDQFYQKLQYAGLGWVRKDGIKKRLEDWTSKIIPLFNSDNKIDEKI